MTQQELKPTNEELAEHIFAWIESLDGDGLIITDTQQIRDLLFDDNYDFQYLRSLFVPEMYDSIRDYVDSQD